ncbi:MAG: MFS transporter [Deinococcota bacterium]
MPATFTSAHVRIFVVYLCAYFLSYFFRSANAVIADDLMRDLSLTAEQLGRMTSIFFVPFALAQLPAGVAFDRCGARWVTPIVMFTGVLGLALFATANSFTMLTIGRALIGLGTSAILMGAFTSFSRWFPASQLASVFSVLVGLGAFGGIGAATPLALLNRTFGWRAVFAGGSVVFLASALAILIWGQDAPRPEHAARDTTGTFADIFRSLPFWRIGLVNFAMTSALFAFQGLWAGPYLLDAIGLSEVAMGNILTALGLGAITGFFVCGILADKFGIAKTFVGACSLLTILLGLISVFPSDGARILLAGLFFSYGLCGAFSLLALSDVRRVFPANMTGRAATAINLCGFGGSALVQWGVGVFVSTFALNEAGRYPGVAYRSAFAGMGVICLLALVVYLPRLRMVLKLRRQRRIQSVS